MEPAVVTNGGPLFPQKLTFSPLNSVCYHLIMRGQHRLKWRHFKRNLC